MTILFSKKNSVSKIKQNIRTLIKKNKYQKHLKRIENLLEKGQNGTEELINLSKQNAIQNTYCFHPFGSVIFVKNI